jgi:hypothetical protein
VEVKFPLFFHFQHRRPCWLAKAELTLQLEQQTLFHALPLSLPALAEANQHRHAGELDAQRNNLSQD